MRRLLIPTMLLVTGAMVAASWWQDARRDEPAARPAPTALAGIPPTTRAGLETTAAALKQRMAERPDDGDAVVQLADVLIRLQRVDSDAAAVVEAEQLLREFLARQPDHYESQRALGAVLLSQHRYREAIHAADVARAIDPRDAVNYGVIGDANLELGDYDAAFAAFDRMGSLRPGASAYARVAYALELKGDLDGALEQMKMAADATSGHDAESQAWHYAQLGNLLLQHGRLGDAQREFERAAFTFPNHPYAMTGLARVKIAEGEYAGALAMYQRMFDATPTPELAFVMGDLHARLGQPDRAEERYREGETLERDGWASEEPQPQALARFLAERDRKIPEAIALAEEAATTRRDINTMDALAWAYFKGGRLDDARRASDAATRLGTRDARLLWHAAEIRERSGDAAGARALRARAATPMPELLLLTGDGLPTR